MPIRHRRSFPPIEMPQSGLRGISRDFSRLFPCGGQVAYVLLTRAPVAGGVQQADRPAAPRLACVKPVASVHPEPGSNSSLLFILSFFFFLQKSKKPRLSVFVICLHGAPCRRRPAHFNNDGQRISRHRLDSGFTRGCPAVSGDPCGPSRRPPPRKLTQN